MLGKVTLDQPLKVIEKDTYFMSHPSIICFEETKQRLHGRVRFLLGLAVFLTCLFPLYSWLRGEETIFLKYLSRIYIGDNNNPDCELWLLLLDRVLFITLLLSAWEVIRGGKNRIFLSFIFVWFLGEAFIIRYFDNHPPYSQYSPINQGLRYLGVLAAILLWRTKWIESVEKNVGSLGGLWVWVLRIGVAMTFMGHGLSAFWGNPGFIGLVNGSLMTFNESWRIGQDQDVVNWLLKPIGVIDIILGLFIILPGQRFHKAQQWACLYLTFWGLVTAFSRVTSGGFEQWHAVVLRSMYFIAPFCLYLYFKSCLLLKRELRQLELLNTQENHR